MSFNVLIVDDSKTIRAIIAKTLKLAKLDIGEIYEAGDGKEGLECLKTKHVDVVLSDLNMPVMTGLEMVAREGLIEKIPVVVVSTDGSTARIEELKQQGVREYIRKPFTPESIGAVIEGVLGVRKA
jgi:two-component system chemotaxis response regulator CheY